MRVPHLRLLTRPPHSLTPRMDPLHDGGGAAPSTRPACVTADRRSGRARVVSSRFGAVVSDAERAAATAARLDALEADDDVAAGGAYGLDDADDDDEFVPSDEEAAEAGGAGAGAGAGLRIGGPSNPAAAARAAAAAARKTRAARAADATTTRRAGGGPRTYAGLLEEAGLGGGGEEGAGGGGGAAGPNWVTAAVGPPVASSGRRPWCSICGLPGGYACVRCRARFCGRRCGGVHAETRCLKMVG